MHVGTHPVKSLVPTRCVLMGTHGNLTLGAWPPRPSDRFVALYKSKGFTQESLAEASGVSQSGVSRFGVGDNILPESAAAIASTLGTSVAYLNGETDDPSPSVAAAEPEQTLEAALLRALDKTRHTLADARAVEDVLRPAMGLAKGLDIDHAARQWLDAAAALRRAQQPVTVGTLLFRVTGSRAAGTRDLNAEGDRELASLGGQAPPIPTRNH